jgi:hypothetical protein
MLVAGSSSAPHSSSITPPPSSQPRNIKRAVNSATPEHCILSSPPPTVNGARRETGASLGQPTQEQIASSSEEELRELLSRTLTENAKLEASVGAARMSAAHYKLQHNLLTIESEEALKRMEVEHQMTRREVQILQNNGRETTNATEYVNKLKTYCKSLEDENALLHRRLNRAKKIIDGKDDDLIAAAEKITMLEERLRQNREHINGLRSPGGPLHISTPKTTPATPQYRTTQYTPTSHRSIRYTPQHHHESQERFSALIAAAASQENNSAPSTPRTHGQYVPRSSHKHNRGVQSLSSLPNTPGSGRPLTATSTLLASAQFSPQAEARLASNLGHVRHREHRRKSRDSTISASDNEEIAQAAASARREDSEDIQESQASQSATEMLRIDPRESFEVAASRTTTPLPSEKNISQAKIFTSVTKRKLDLDHGIEPSKKMRTGAIGLGIDYESTRV